MRATLGIAGIVFLIGSTANVASSDATSGLREFSIAENASVGSPVAQLGNDSPDPPAAVTWSVAHDGQPIPFVVDRATGALTVADQTLDFERQARHEFTVRARRPRPLDSARRAYMADLLESGVDPETIDDLLFEVTDHRIAVLVTDAPERPVLAPGSLTLVLDGDGNAATAPILANDPDADDAHTYEVIAGDDNRFQIDPQTGALQWLPTATAESGSYPLTVQVTDSTGLRDAATFNVQVIATTPTVDAIVADVVLPDDAGTVTPAVEPVLAEDDPPADIDPAPIAADIDPVPPEAGPVDRARPIATVPQDADLEAVAALPVAVEPETAASMTPPGTVGAASGAITTADLAVLIPLGLILIAIGLTGVWMRRRKQNWDSDAEPAPFRVVREAPAAMEALAAGNAPAAMTDNELPADRLSQLDSAMAEKAAVHQLMASAFQQATGQSLPAASAPAAIVEEPIAGSELPAVVTGESFTFAGADFEPPFEEPAQSELPVLEAPAFAAPQLPELDQFRPAESALSAGLPSAGEFNEIGTDEDGFGTEPYTSPHEVVGEPASELHSIEMQDDALAQPLYDVSSLPEDPLPSTYGYSVEDEELAGGYHGLRLSQSSEPSPMDEHSSFGAPGELTDDYRAEPAAQADEDGEDQKLMDLRRQLSDLFGVPADRPRAATAPSDTVDEPEFEEEVATVDAVEIAPTIDLQAATMELNFAPAFPPAPVPAAPPPAAPAPRPAPPAPVAASAPPAPASDPVHSWLEYLKQRALEKPGTPSSPAIPAASSYVAPAPTKPVATPAPAPAPVVAAARQTVPPVRVNKSAVREEISMLRDLANQHSRNVLARRALNQRARITWLLWGTAMVVLCFSGLWSVRHDASGMRMLGWGLLGGAGLALVCCVYGFYTLNRRNSGRTAGEESDELATVEDLEAAVSPELMTPEMEQRLREVLEEARNVPATAETRS